MFGAEWKKIIRDRWFVVLTVVLLTANLMLFFYSQQTVHRAWLYSVPQYKEYEQKISGMEEQEADKTLMEEMVKLGNLYTIQQALNGEIPEEVLEVLEMENPGILEEFQNSEYKNSPEKLEGRMTAAGELQRQMAYIRSYPEFITSIEANYENMKQNSFYENRPYAKKLGEKTVKDYHGLEKLSLETGMEYGIRAVLENTSTDVFLLILIVYVCTVSIVPEKNRNLFTLLRSSRYGRAKLAAVKFLTIAFTTILLYVLFYGSLWGSAAYLYGLGPLKRPVQSLEILKGNCSTLTVGQFLADSYFRTAIGMTILAFCVACVILFMNSALSAIGSLLVASVFFITLYNIISPLSKVSWLHFINPVQWFSRIEEYGNYQTVSFFGEPVRTMDLNLLFMAALLAASLAGGIYIVCVRSLNERYRDKRIFKSLFDRIKDAKPYSGYLFFWESWKQFIKNRVLWLLVLSLFAIALSAERTPVNREKKEQQYRNYIDRFGGPVSEKTLDSINIERERIYRLQEELAVMGEQLKKGEISEEKYEAVSTMVERQTEMLEALERVALQAEDLLEYENGSGIQLFLTDELAGDFLLDQREYDQRQGVLLMTFLILLLSGIFPGEQKNGMINLIRSTKQGMAPLFISKLVLGICLCVPLGAGAAVVKIISTGFLYDFSEWNIPVQSFVKARGIEKPCSLIEFCVLSGLMEIFALCCISLIYMSLSLWMKNQFYAILTGGAFFVLPLVLGGGGLAFPWEYTGNRAFFIMSCMAEAGVGKQIGYLLIFLLTAIAAVLLAWRKYSNRR